MIGHVVNAILHFQNGKNVDNEDRSRPMIPSNLQPATYVIFNHPHLGVEDAARHAHFLSHLFHSVVNGWMERDGRFFLTLAAGQWERWEGAVTAQKPFEDW